MSARPNHLDAILGTDLALDYHIDVVTVFPHSEGYPQRPTVYVNSTTLHRKLGQEEAFYKCQIFTDGTMAECFVNQATYDRIVALSEAQDLIRAARSLKEKNREGLQAYIHAIQAKMDVIQNQSIRQRLEAVRLEAEQMLLVKYKKQRAEFNEQLGLRNSDSDNKASGFAKLIPFSRDYKSKPIEKHVFIDMLDCIVAISNSMQVIGRAGQDSFLTCRDEMKLNLLISIEDRFYESPQDILELNLFYVSKILERVAATRGSPAHFVLLDMISRINGLLLQHLDSPFNMANDASAEKLQQYLVKFQLLIQDLPDDLKDALRDHEGAIHQRFMAIHNQKVADQTPDRGHSVFPLHALLRNADVSIDEVRAYLQRSPHKIDIDERDLQEKSVLDLLRQCKDPRVIQLIAGNCLDEAQKRKLKPLLPQENTPAVEREKPSIEGCRRILNLLRGTAGSQNGVLEKLNAIDKILAQIKEQPFL